MGVSKSWRGGEHTRLPPKPVSRSGDVAAVHWLWPAQNKRSIKHTLMEESVLVGLGQVVAFTVIFVGAFASHSVVSQSTGDFTAWNSISVLMVTDRRRSELISSQQASFPWISLQSGDGNGLQLPCQSAWAWAWPIDTLDRSEIWTWKTLPFSSMVDVCYERTLA